MGKHYHSAKGLIVLEHDEMMGLLTHRDQWLNIMDEHDTILLADLLVSRYSQWICKSLRAA